MFKRKFIKDILINIVAVLLPIMILQFFSLPLVAKFEGGEDFGIVVFLISVFTIIAFPLGNVLNNTRLLLNEEYSIKKVKGDFNLLLIISVVLGLIIFSTFMFFYKGDISLTSFILILIIITLYIMREYFVVSFRLTLSFKNILFNNIYHVVGYILGTFLYLLTKHWEFIYLVGLLLSNIYILLNSKLYKEGFKRTKLIKKTVRHSTFLYCANILKNIVNHADKLLILPLLGPINVAIYYSAAIVGKIIAMAINPINTVVLSYLVKTKEKKNISLFLFLGIFVGIIGYSIILLIGPIFLNYFYIEWAIESINILKYTAASSILLGISSLLQPFNLRFNNIKWQLYINGAYLFIYLLFTISLTNYYGLVGFSIGVLIANLCNLLFQVTIYNLDSKTAE